MDRRALYNQFLKRFPIEQLGYMTIEEFTNLEKKDSFCYWLESKTSELGSIWGGSSYKFGIFKYDKTPKQDNPKYSHDNIYSWSSRLGKTYEEAFNNVRDAIVKIAHYARNEQWEEIEKIDTLWPVTTWKIAFLYSNEQLLPIYDKNDWLVPLASHFGLTDAKKYSRTELYNYLLKQKGDKDLYTFYDELIDIMKTNSSDTTKRYWMYAPGENANKWSRCQEQSIICIGWEETGDLSQMNSLEECRDSLKEVFDKPDSSFRNDGLAVWEFSHVMQPGDVVYAKQGSNNIIGRGIVKSEYIYDPSQEDYYHTRKIEWTHVGNWVLKNIVQKTLTDITKYPDYVKKIEAMIVEGKTEEAKEGMYNDKYAAYIKLLLNNSNLILNGAPGTGKTYLAKQVAAQIIYEGNVPDNFEEDTKFMEQCGFVQFHPSYDYTDFVEGLRPTRQNENGNIGFERKDGIFKAFCKKTYINNRDKDIAANSIEFTETYSGGDDFDSLYNSLLEDILHERITEMVSKTGIRYKLEVGSGGNIRISGNDKPAKSVNEKNTRILFDYLIREKIYEIPREWTARHYFNIIAQDPEGPDTIDYKNYEWVLKILLSRYKHIHGESFKDSSMGTPDKVFVSSEPIALNNIKNEDERITRAMEWLMKQSGSTVKSVRGKTEYILVIKQNTIYLRIPNGNENYVNPKGIIRYLKTGEYNKEHQTYEPSIGNFIKENCPLYRNDSSNVIPNKDCSCIEISETKGTLPYIFIIDEINRGEISKIFGELFFSIDPGYRGVKGKVQTQYQNLITEDDPFKDGFYIPENVYIIGTMNDIDRSVECMDFAMRRRFTFKEITAEESAKNMGLGAEATERMMSLNNAISDIDGFNSSFHIGAAYFKGVDDFDGLWELKLAGLLKEYLRGMPDAEESLDALKKAYDLNEE